MSQAILPLLVVVTQLAAAADGASVRGRVTDAVSGAPIAGAVVVLIPSSVKPQAVRANEDGRYEFTALQPGRYTVRAEPPEFRATHVAADFIDPARPGARGVLELRAGEVRTDVNLTLRRSLAISGRVVDPWGQPLAGIIVVAGSEYPPRGFGRETDDRGTFRIFGLLPGRYLVCTDPRMSRRSMASLGTPKERSLPTCHPSATDQARAVRVVLGKTDVDGVEIEIVRGRTYSISGTVLESGGAPARVRVGVHEWSDGGSSSRTTSIQADGRFRVEGLLPRDYILTADNAGPLGPNDTRNVERAEVRVTVANDNVDGLVIAMKPAVTLRGRVVFEGAAAPKLSGTMGVSAASAATVDAFSERPRATVSADLTFALRQIVAPSTIVLDGLPAGWVMHTVRYKGRDITDTPTTFSANTDDIEIVVNQRGSVISGRVNDEVGTPVRDARVVLFPADAAKWRTVPADRAVLTSPDGRFRFEPRRAGDYLVAAVPSSDMPPLPVPALLQRLSKVAERITLGEGESRSIDLRVVRIPEER